MFHNFFGLSSFFHKPEKFRYKIGAKTFLGENIGPDAKVLVPGCESTGPWMCQIESGNAAGKVR